MSGTPRLGPTAEPPTLRVGDLVLRVFDGGHLWLDGGAMFGIIPRPIWSKLVEVDDVNRIPLATNCLLVETGGARLLVETGVGAAAKFNEKERGFYRFGSHWLADSLEAARVDRESINYVILTHLHFDHAGGATMSDGRGGFVPTFPQARYVVQRGEWEDAVAGHTVMSGTYRPENLAPLEAAGVLLLVDGEAEIVPGVRVCPLPGHTRHQQMVVFESAGRRAIQPADLMPTSAHAGLRFNMAYDLLPFENMRNKERLLADAASRATTLLLGHDPAGVAWRVQREKTGRYHLRPAGP